MIAYIFHYFCKLYVLKLFGQMLAGFALKLISLQQIDKIFHHIPFSFIGHKDEFPLIISLALRKTPKSSKAHFNLNVHSGSACLI